MKNILIVFALLLTININAQEYIIASSDFVLQGATEVISETQGIEMDFPVLATPYNLKNTPNYKFHYFGRKEDEANGEIKTKTVSRRFGNLDEFLITNEYKDIQSVINDGLKIFVIETGSKRR